MSAPPELPDASREAFEAAYRQIHPCPALSQDYKGIYFEFSTELAWQTWQASRKQALEEAAKVCETQIDPTRPASTSGFAYWHAKQIKELLK